MANCGAERDFQESGGGMGGVAHGAGGVGGRSASGGRSAGFGGAGGEQTGGAPSLEGGGGGVTGPDEPGAGAGGAASAGGPPAGGMPATGGAEGGVDAGGNSSGGAPEADECRFNVHCMDSRRPFCSDAHRCVACLQATHCPAPSKDCYAPSCVLGECREVVKAGGVACGSSSSSACDAPDTCDGAGHCLPNYAALGASCEDGVHCDGVDTCDGQGRCSHSANPCSGARNVCHEDTKTCTCDTATRIDDASYCGPQTEANDRPAAEKARIHCLGCGASDTDNFTRSSANGCMEFRCQP